RALGGQIWLRAHPRHELLGRGPGALSRLPGLNPTGVFGLFGGCARARGCFGLTRALDCCGLTRALGLLARPRGPVGCRLSLGLRLLLPRCLLCRPALGLALGRLLVAADLVLALGVVACEVTRPVYLPALPAGGQTASQGELLGSRRHPQPRGRPANPREATGPPSRHFFVSTRCQSRVLWASRELRLAGHGRA